MTAHSVLLSRARCLCSADLDHTAGPCDTNYLWLFSQKGIPHLSTPVKGHRGEVGLRERAVHVVRRTEWSRWTENETSAFVMSRQLDLFCC